VADKGIGKREGMEGSFLDEKIARNFERFEIPS